MMTVFADSGISRNYYYKRARYELPFNTNDISQIAQALGISPDEIISAAIKRTAHNELPSLDAQRQKNVGGATDTDEIPENVEEAWVGEFAADPKGDDPIDHS